MRLVSGLKFGVLDYAVMLCFLCYAASAVLLAISLVEMSRPAELDFSLTGGGAIHATRMMTVFLVLFGSGFLAARFGRCRSVGISTALLTVGLSTIAFAPSYALLIPAVILTGFGQGVIEGLLNPVIQGCHPDDSARYLNILNAFWSIGVVGTMVVGGELLSLGVPWRMLFFAAAAAALIPAWLFLRYGHRLPEGRVSRPKKTLRQMKAAFRLRRFWSFYAMMLLAGGAEAAFTYWSASYLQRDFGSSARFAGFAAAVFSVGMILTRVLAGALLRQSGLRRMMMAMAVAAIVVSGIFPLAGGRGTVIFLLFFAGVTTSCFWPTLQSYACDCLKADSTMIFILLSCAGIPGAGIMVFLMGMLGDLVGLRWSFLIAPITFFDLLLLLRKDARDYPENPFR